MSRYSCLADSLHDGHVRGVPGNDALPGASDAIPSGVCRYRDGRSVGRYKTGNRFTAIARASALSLRISAVLFDNAETQHDVIAQNSVVNFH